MITNHRGKLLESSSNLKSPAGLYPPSETRSLDQYHLIPDIAQLEPLGHAGPHQLTLAGSLTCQTEPVMADTPVSTDSLIRNPKSSSGTFTA